MSNRRCRGTNRQQQPCGLPPAPGQLVCRFHGARSPQALAAAARRLEREAAEDAVTAYGLPREVDPGQALLEEVHRTAGHVAWLSRVVADLERDDLVWGVVEEIERPAVYGEDGTHVGGGTETKRKAAPSTWLTLYQDERKHLASVSKAAIDAGVSERMVSLYEQLAASYVQVMESVLDELGLTDEQRRRVPVVLESKLRAIAGGAPEAG